MKTIKSKKIMGSILVIFFINTMTLGAQNLEPSAMLSQFVVSVIRADTNFIRKAIIEDSVVETFCRIKPKFRGHCNINEVLLYYRLSFTGNVGVLFVDEEMLERQNIFFSYSSFEISKRDKNIIQVEYTFRLINGKKRHSCCRLLLTDNNEWKILEWRI